MVIFFFRNSGVPRTLIFISIVISGIIFLVAFLARKASFIIEFWRIPVSGIDIVLIQFSALEFLFSGGLDFCICWKHSRSRECKEPQYGQLFYGWDNRES
jgi:hypothetical protein